MASALLVLVAGCASNFSASYKMFDVISFISQQPCYIIGHIKLENFRVYGYVAISSFISVLLSYSCCGCSLVG